MMPMVPGIRRRWLAPEVVQTSATDCGPAALTCLLGGFGISVSYGRLREACQTDVDGTSIDTLEEAAVQLGLEVEQVMVPVDHLLLPEAETLPALVVVRLANGFTHFVIAWRRHGRCVQVMDPATGRRWPTRKRFIDELYIHTLPISAATWRAWASMETFLASLRRRWALLGLGGPAEQRTLTAALDDPDWYPLAALDATTRMVDAMVRAGGLGRGRPASRLLAMCYERARHQGLEAVQEIPAAYWTVRPDPSGPEGEVRLLLRGAVLMRVLGRRLLESSQRDEKPLDAASDLAPLSPELAAALAEPPSTPGRTLLHFVSAQGSLELVGLMVALGLAAIGVVVEPLLLRSLFDLDRELGLVQQRLGVLAALLSFMAVLLGLELPMIVGLLRLGRQLELRMRQAFLEKIPRLGDRYFQSRPTSDMAERSHVVHLLRLLPVLGGQYVQRLFEVVLITVGIIWLTPASAVMALLAAVCAVGLPIVIQRFLSEQDMRIRTHTGALGSFYLDALLGLIAVRTHGAERAIQREHESLLVEWRRASRRLQRTVAVFEGLQGLLGFGLAAWLLVAYITQSGLSGGVLLLTYWALSLPLLGQEMVLLVRQYPRQRNATLRLLEPLGALEETIESATYPVPTEAVHTRGVALALQNVSVRAAGHIILDNVDLVVPAGSHVAIVGPSGAGKSTLVGLLLGWHRAASGQVCVDGFPLDSQRLAQLRQDTAWVDPTVQLWNRSLLENLHYGIHGDHPLPLATIIEQAELRSVLEKFPDGLQTSLGEGGRFISGGEGQRVRLGRAMLRPGVRLVILDEPFRGLDREQRRTLLARARSLWQGATLLCITHDVDATRKFDRVLVVEGGRIIEDGAPDALATRVHSRYRALVEAEAAVRERLWAGHIWRRLRLEDGRLVEGHDQERDNAGVA